jgi:hypothetical protein
MMSLGVADLAVGSDESEIRKVRLMQASRHMLLMHLHECPHVLALVLLQLCLLPAPRNIRHVRGSF